MYLTWSTYAEKKILLLILLIVCIGTSPAQNKTALVIGNSGYQYFPKLQQAGQEAGSMKAALERLGFEVIYVTDGSYDRMYDALDSFEHKFKQRGGIVLFHFRGHGIQVNSENYLLPVDKDSPDELRVRSRAMNASEVVDLMAAAGSATIIVILDACRDNPLPAQARSANSRGLAILQAPVNTVVVYSAEAGQTAEDGVRPRRGKLSCKRHRTREPYCHYEIL
ncbi:MAG: caspase family protein [Sediminispirochaetaceae bacterium]